MNLFIVLTFCFHEKSNPLTGPERAKKKPVCCHMKVMKPIKVLAPYEKQGQCRRIFHVFFFNGKVRFCSVYVRTLFVITIINHLG